MGRDELDPELLQGPSDLCFPARIEGFARLGRPDKMTGAIGIERAEHAARPDDLLKSRHHRLRTLLIHEGRIVELIGRIITDSHQILIRSAGLRQPGVLARINVQQQARQRPPLSSLPVRPSFARFRHESRRL